MTADEQAAFPADGIQRRANADWLSPGLLPLGYLCACSLPSAGTRSCSESAVPSDIHLNILHPAMTAHSFALPVIIFTTFWGLIGIAGPWFVPKGPNRG